MFKFDIDRLDGDNELGQGEYGRVFVYEAPNTGRKCAVKMVRPRNIEELRMYIEELVLSFNHSHSAILPITGFHIDEEKPKGWTVYMRMQLMTKNLRKLIQEHKKDNSFLSKDNIIRIFHALAAGFEYLFSRNIVHRDIKPENILLDEADNVKIGDIGIAKFKSPDDTTRTMMSIKGTPTYMAPELFQPDLEWSQENLCKADVWSLGVTIMELCLIECEKILPHLHISEKAKIVERNLEKVKKRYGSDLSAILSDMVHIDPVKRKSFESIAKTLREAYPSVAKIKQQDYSTSPSFIRELKARFSKFEQEIEDKKEKISKYQGEQQKATRKIGDLEGRASQLEQVVEEKEKKIREYQIELHHTRNKNIWMWVVLIASLVFNMGASMNFFYGMWPTQNQVSSRDSSQNMQTQIDQLNPTIPPPLADNEESVVMTPREIEKESSSLPDKIKKNLDGSKQENSTKSKSKKRAKTDQQREAATSKGSDNIQETSKTSQKEEKSVSENRDPEIEQSSRKILDQANDLRIKPENFWQTISNQTCEKSEAPEIESIGRKDWTIISLSSLWIQIIPISALVLAILKDRVPVYEDSMLWQYIKIGIFLTLISVEDILYSLKDDYQNIDNLAGMISFIVHSTVLTGNIGMAFAGFLNLIDDSAKSTLLQSYNNTNNQTRFMLICCSYMTRIIILALINLVLSSTTLIYVIIQLSLSIVFLILFLKSRIGDDNDTFNIPGLIFLLTNLTVIGIMYFCPGSGEIYAPWVMLGDTVAKLSFVPFIFI